MPIIPCRGIGFTNRRLLICAVVLQLAAAFTSSSHANQVFSWGRNYYGQLDVPPGLTNAIAISAGYQHCLALKNDGSIVAWGQNTNNQLNIPAAISNNAVAISAGWYHSLALLDDGSLVGWGAGLANTGTAHEYGQSIIPPNVTNVLSIAAGRYFSMALLSDRTVAVWGENLYGQTNIPTGLTNVSAIAANGLHCMALKSDGTVVCWGGNGAGESSVPADLLDVVGIAAGNYESYAIKSDGSLAVWGDNTVGQSTVPGSVSNVVAASGGAYHSVAIMDNGTPVAWGNYDSTLPAGITNTIAVTSGFYMGLALTNDGSPIVTLQPCDRRVFTGNSTSLRALVSGDPPMTYQWSFNGTPIPHATNATLNFPFVEMTNAGAYSFVAGNEIGSVTSSNAVLTVREQLPIMTAHPASVISYRFGPAAFTAAAIGSLPITFQWQLNGTNVPGATNGTLSIPNAAVATAGSYSLIASNEFGTVTSSNATLTLLNVVDNGDSSYNFYHYAVPRSLTNAVAIAAGSFHSMALKPDGSLIIWGNNQYGQTNIPASATNIAAIAAGGSTCAMIRSNGTLFMWGDSYFPGVSNSKTNPPSNATNVAAIAIGANHALVLRKDGTLVAWGDNTFGQTNIPASATNIMAIAVGAAHNIAVRSNGTVLAWGYNNYGQTNIPAFATNVVAVAAGSYHNYILKSDGAAYSWGDVTAPFPNFTDVVRIGTGYYSPSYFALLRSGGSVVGGYVTGISNGVAISAGGTHNLVLIGDGLPYLYWPPNAFPAAHTGDTISTRVRVSGAGPIYYQWQLNGTNLVGATNATLNLTNIPITSAGIYTCIISNQLGSITSPDATLAVQRYPLTFSVANGNTQMTTEGFKLRIGGLAGQGELVVYSSTNLLDWTPIFTNAPVVGSFDLVDSNATNQPSIFYRANEGW